MYKKKIIFLLIPLLYSLPSFSQSLVHLIRTATSEHPSILRATSDLSASKQAKNSALWQFFPKPSFQAQNAGASKNNPNFQGDDVVYSISIEQPIWQGGKRISELKQAQLDIVIANAKVTQKKYDIAFELIQAYGKWTSSYLKIQALEQSIAQHKKMLERVKNRVKAGVSNRGDIDLALSRLEATKSDFLNFKFEQSNAVAQIIEIINQPVTSNALSTEMDKSQEITYKQQGQDFEHRLNQAIVSHPAMLIAQHEAKKAEKNKSISQSALLPEVFFRAERQYGHFAFEDAKPMNTFLVGIKSQLGPGLSSLSDIKKSAAQLRSATMDIEIQKRKIRRQIIDDQMMIQSLKARKKSTEITLTSAKNVFDSYGRQFLAGKKSWLDLMNSLREMTNNEVKLADIKASLIVISTRQDITINGLADYKEVIK